MNWEESKMSETYHSGGN